jgi:hypothetical protein
MAMTRTTIMADDRLLDRLREIAKAEGVSLAEIIRQGMEWRALRTRRRPPSFIGAISTGEGEHDTASRDEEILLEYFRQRDARL